MLVEILCGGYGCRTKTGIHTVMRGEQCEVSDAEAARLIGLGVAKCAFSAPTAPETAPADVPATAEGNDTPAVEACMKKVVAGGAKLWVNSLWPSLCGGLCDDAALEGDPSAVYGKLVDMGATMIQTDRPELLISYLRSRGLHD